ncbi:MULTISPECIES: flippase [Terrisporobacter]|uniref:Flippase n=1 Tax=Terrisporobacter muris TaxID=2963284 RepID=A0A9X2MA90_9FIRM|nr:MULTISPECIES: flippase [Terrisporobacter]MCR1822458.1 flippase [Terrisporobacter muris]MDU6983226.1 flippase [Terrisporobacter othiniensis]
MAYKADSIFKNQFFNFSMQILNLIFPLLAIPYTTRLFGPEILGEVNFANSIVQYFVLIAAAGIPVYATREIAKARDDASLLRKKFKEFTILQTVFTIVSLIAYIVIILFLPRLRANIYIYLFLGLQIFANAFDFVWFLQGIEKYRYAAIATFVSKLMNVVLIFALLRNRSDYYIYAFIIGITLLINSIIKMIFTIKLLKNFEAQKSLEINFNSIKMHVYAILVFFLSNVATKVYTAMDQTMLGMLDSTESVGYYSMSIRLEKVILTFVTSIAVVMIPRISNSIKNNNIKDVKKYIGMSVNIVYLIAIPAIFGILAIGEEIIPIFLGKEFLQSISIFKMVSLLLLIIGLSNVFGMQVMIPYGKEKKFTLILSLAALANFIINLILIPRLSYFGATYATIFAELIVTVWMYFEVKKLVGHIPEIFRPWKMLIPSVLFYLIIKFVIKNMITSDILVILVSVPVAGIVYGVGLILLKEKITMNVLNKIFGKLKKKHA